MTKAGKLIKDTRLKKRVTQGYLAIRVKAHIQQISNIENGHVGCPVRLGRLIAFELGISAQKMKRALLEDYSERNWK